jgi:hypothetical protein
MPPTKIIFVCFGKLVECHCRVTYLFHSEWCTNQLTSFYEDLEECDAVISVIETENVFIGSIRSRISKFKPELDSDL